MMYVGEDSKAYIYLFLSFLCIPAVIYLGNLERVVFIVDHDELRVMTKTYTLNMRFKEMESIDIKYHKTCVKHIKITDVNGQHVELTYMIDHLSQLLLELSHHIKDRTSIIRHKEDFNLFYQRAVYQDLLTKHYKKILYYFLIYVAGYILYVMFCPKTDQIDLYLIYLASYVVVNFIIYLTIFLLRLKVFLKVFDQASNRINHFSFDLHYLAWLLLTITHLILIIIS